jgi:hypothetical protein
MNLSGIATEIRLKIFSELLVLSEPIDFVADYGPPSPPLFRRRRDGLYPAILRVSRMMHLEASPLLYSNNRFQFPEVFTSTPSAPTSAHIGPFLHQIGSRASLIHYICIPFFTFHYPQPARAILHEAHVRNLQLIRDTCTSIQTLELLIPPERYNYALSHSPIATEALDLLNTRLKSILSLKEIIVHFQVYPEGDASNDLMKKMNNYGWAVNVTKLPKKVWISCDDRVEFDNEEDCNAYNEEQFRREEERREEEEKELWLDEYYRRRRDPYWKNDSDYD